MLSVDLSYCVEYSWNVHGDAREGKWRGNWRMEWVASTLHTTSEHGVSSITTTDAHISAASIRLNWRHRRFKWTRPFRRKTKSGSCACAITFQTQSTRCNWVTGRKTVEPTAWTRLWVQEWSITGSWERHKAAKYGVLILVCEECLKSFTIGNCIQILLPGRSRNAFWNFNLAQRIIKSGLWLQDFFWDSVVL